MAGEIGGVGENKALDTESLLKSQEATQAKAMEYQTKVTEYQKT